ncbi:MerR family transcriptional regulator [Hoyosella sp. YIM 151337]|uniref:MerR family transcriptional regulator n=1 Tax=Hoyosella sp. YIM 151337 TaxID=2992742 RepID=UPI00223670D1|nr:MerR family transcriptional regulator [Hoyosella sp. YIM 151337]MCW4355934.1 MerR family transcriptional regulator [Hoyosella sp. YIM 151337]
MKIGEAARRLGVAEHVLRHWDDVGAVVPDRTASGHREYSEEHLHRLQVLRACQSVGMSLPEIRHVLHRSEPGRTRVIERQLHRIRAQRAQLEDAERFLVHVITCEHDLLTRCEACTKYAATTL